MRETLQALSTFVDACLGLYIWGVGLFYLVGWTGQPSTKWLILVGIFAATCAINASLRLRMAEVGTER